MKPLTEAEFTPGKPGELPGGGKWQFSPVSPIPGEQSVSAKYQLTKGEKSKWYDECRSVTCVGANRLWAVRSVLSRLAEKHDITLAPGTTPIPENRIETLTEHHKRIYSEHAGCHIDIREEIEFDNGYLTHSMQYTGAAPARFIHPATNKTIIGRVTKLTIYIDAETGEPNKHTFIAFASPTGILKYLGFDEDRQDFDILTQNILTNLIAEIRAPGTALWQPKLSPDTFADMRHNAREAA